MQICTREYHPALVEKVLAQRCLKIVIVIYITNKNLVKWHSDRHRNRPWSHFISIIVAIEDWLMGAILQVARGTYRNFSMVLVLIVTGTFHACGQHWPGDKGPSNLGSHLCRLLIVNCETNKKGLGQVMRT